MADTGFKSPTTNGVPSTYDGSATEFTDPTNAYADDSSYATAVDNEANYKYQSYGGFGLSVPAGATIVGIEATAKGKTSSGSQTDVGFVIYDTSTAQWSSGPNSGTFTTSEGTITVGGPTSLWSQTWVPSDFDDANFKYIFKSSSFDSPSGRTVSLNHVQIKVYYSEGMSTSDSVSVSESVSVAFQTLTLSVSDSISVTDSATPSFVLVEINDSITVTEYVNVKLPIMWTDRSSVSDTWTDSTRPTNSELWDSF